MQSHDTALAAKVAAQNEANAVANQHTPALLAALSPFMGKNVCKVTGELLAKVKAALPALPDYSNNRDVSCWVSTGHGYSITLNVKTCHGQRKKDYTGAHYAETLVYLGELSNGELSKLYPFEPRHTDYTEAEIIAARKEVNAAKDALSKAQGKLAGFGEHDN